MSTHNCNVCGYDSVADDAVICPKCNTKNHKDISGQVILGMVLGFIFAIGFSFYKDLSFREFLIAAAIAVVVGAVLAAQD